MANDWEPESGNDSDAGLADEMAAETVDARDDDRITRGWAVGQ